VAFTGQAIRKTPKADNAASATSTAAVVNVRFAFMLLLSFVELMT